MPQASDEQRNLMGKWFGDRIDLDGPLLFLQRRGWTERGGMLTMPTPSYTPSTYEWACVDFLCDEWDFAHDPALTTGNRNP